jgi:hypothetical protein
VEAMVKPPWFCHTTTINMIEKNNQPSSLSHRRHHTTNCQVNRHTTRKNNQSPDGPTVTPSLPSQHRHRIPSEKDLINREEEINS